MDMLKRNETYHPLLCKSTLGEAAFEKEREKRQKEKDKPRRRSYRGVYIQLSLSARSPSALPITIVLVSQGATPISLITSPSISILRFLVISLIDFAFYYRNFPYRYCWWNPSIMFSSTRSAAALALQCMPTITIQ